MKRPVRELEKERDELARILKEAWSAWSKMAEEVSKLQKEKEELEKLVKHLQSVAISRDERMLEFSIEVARALARKT